MQPRLIVLRRLGAVYGLIEEMHSLEARVAAGNVVEVESVLDAERRTAESSRVQQREAMCANDLLGQSATAVREELAIRRNRQLEPMLLQRRDTLAHAQLRYTESRIWSERMQTLIEEELRRSTLEKERRMQAASDDRFLSQRRARTGTEQRRTR
jgi:hypothetical protein